MLVTVMVSNTVVESESMTLPEDLSWKRVR